MLEKYDLKEMLEEIREDETSSAGVTKGEASQDMIKKMMMEQLKKPGKNNE